MSKEPEKIQIEKVILPEGEWPTLQDVDDVNVWLRFNIVLQANAENVAETGDAGDGTRQLRLLTAECIRRGMFERRIAYHKTQDTLTDSLLLTWYEVLKQFLEGEVAGKWKSEGDSNREYTLVVKELLARGVQMPRQEIDLESLDMLGEIIV